MNIKNRLLENLLERLHSHGAMSVRELTSEEITLAEELLSRGLLTKVSTCADSVFTEKEVIIKDREDNYQDDPKPSVNELLEERNK